MSKNNSCFCMWPRSNNWRRPYGFHKQSSKKGRWYKMDTATPVRISICCLIRFTKGKQDKYSQSPPCKIYDTRAEKKLQVWQKPFHLRLELGETTSTLRQRKGRAPQTIHHVVMPGRGGVSQWEGPVVGGHPVETQTWLHKTDPTYSRARPINQWSMSAALKAHKRFDFEILCWFGRKCHQRSATPSSAVFLKEQWVSNDAFVFILLQIITAYFTSTVHATKATALDKNQLGAVQMHRKNMTNDKNHTRRQHQVA